MNLNSYNHFYSKNKMQNLQILQEYVPPPCTYLWSIDHMVCLSILRKGSILWDDCMHCLTACRADGVWRHIQRMTGGLILLSCGPHFGLGSDGRDGTVGTWKVRVTVPTKQKTSAITHSDWIGLDWLFDPLRAKGQGRGKG